MMIVARNLHASEQTYSGMEKQPTSVKQETDTARSQHSLLHWEALLVATSHDLEHIALEFLPAKSINQNHWTPTKHT